MRIDSAQTLGGGLSDLQPPSFYSLNSNLAGNKMVS